MRRKRPRGDLLEAFATAQQNLCGICGRVVAREERSLDHIVPRSAGGTAARANLRLTHVACNNKRGNVLETRAAKGLYHPPPSLPALVSEDAFESHVEQAAHLLGWRFYHTHDSRRSAPGFPDLVLIRERLIFAELKTETGKLTKPQQEWRDHLLQCGEEWHLWTPSQWDAIEAALR